MRTASGVFAGLMVLFGGAAARAQDAQKPVVYNHLTDAGASMDQLVHATYDNAFKVVDFADDEAIYMPPHVLYGPQPTPRGKDVGAQRAGSVVVFFIITAEGQVKQPVVVASSDPDLNLAVLTTISRWIFSAARVNGRPVAVTAGQEFTLP